VFRPVLAIVLLYALAAGQQNTSPSKTSPSPIPLFEIRLSPDPDSSITFADSSPVVSTQCDANGNPFIKTFGPDGLQILGFTPKGVIAFATNQMTDIPEARATDFFVTDSALYVLVTGIENARKEEIIYKDEAGQEKKRLETKGDSRDYIARFDRDGSYRGSLKLDFNFHPIQFAAFDSGSFVVAGLDESRVPRVGLLNSNGQLVKYLQLPKDITDKPKSAEKSFATSGLSASVDVIAMFAQFHAYSGNMLLVRAGSETPIYEIRESGEVRTVRVKIPNGLTVDHLIPSSRNWFIGVRKSVLADESETIYEISPESGKPLRLYRIENKDGPKEALACEDQGTFSGIRHQQGRLTVLRGTAEPVKQKASSVAR
jgi:hypothetical protein